MRLFAPAWPAANPPALPERLWPFYELTQEAMLKNRVDPLLDAFTFLPLLDALFSRAQWTACIFLACCLLRAPDDVQAATG